MLVFSHCLNWMVKFRTGTLVLVTRCVTSWKSVVHSGLVRSGPVWFVPVHSGLIRSGPEVSQELLGYVWNRFHLQRGRNQHHL